MSIRAITFDFWNTLFRDANSAARRQLRVDAYARATGIPQEVVAEAVRKTFAEFDRCHRQEQRTLTPYDAVCLTSETLGIAMARDTAQSLAVAFATAVLTYGPVPIDGALDAVRTAARHAAIGLVSDTGVSPGCVIRQLLDQYGFLEFFAASVFSDEVGVSKPQRAMFDAAAAGVGVPTTELMHIGDLEYSDISGAKAVGARAALFTGANSDYRDATQADYTFASWDEFIRRLPALVQD